MNRAAAFLIAVAVCSTAIAAEKDKRTPVRKRINDYSACVVRATKSDARAYVLSGSPPPVSMGCAQRNGIGEARFPDDTYRYALAEALLIAEFPTHSPSIDNSARLDVKPKPEATAGKKLGARQVERLKKAQAAWAMDSIGACTASSLPKASYELALTSIGSVEETRAFETLTPAVAQCVPAGWTLAFNRELLRGTIILNLYRLANTTSSVAQQVSLSRHAYSDELERASIGSFLAEAERA